MNAVDAEIAVVFEVDGDMGSGSALDRAARVRGLILEPGSRARTIPILLAAKARERSDLGVLTATQRSWLKASAFGFDHGEFVLIPDDNGHVGCVVCGRGVEGNDNANAFSAGAISWRLPPGDYRFEGGEAKTDLTALGWCLAAYRFDSYKSKSDARQRRLKLAKGLDRDEIGQLATAVYLGRDLINTPANDLGPDEFEVAVRSLAKVHKASVRVISGDNLLKENFPMIHAVGRASERAPRLIDLTWGAKSAPRVTVVGKGIVFDTGGLSLKPANAMVLMKKDMGGAAAALSLGAMIMAGGLPVRLRILLPVAENSVSANAYRPGDVLPSRNGMTVEIGNTDAEGRLVLADALALADEEAPDALFCFATLTGAARVALGPDLPALYVTSDAFSSRILGAGDAVHDPLWRMPFWTAYNQMLKSNVADVSHISDGSFAGSITAALFLKRFVENTSQFAHLDIYGWVPTAKPGFPTGGEPQGARAIYETLRRSYAR